MALTRLVRAGAVPLDWMTAGSEIMRGWVDQPKAPAFGEIVFTHLPAWRHLGAHTASVREFARKAS